MTDSIIKTKDLKKRYGFKKEAVKGIDLKVPKGSVYAFLGRNGAGKTTTIRMLLGLLEQTSGEIEMLGLNPAKNSARIKERIGYVGENQKMYDWIKIGELASFCRSFHKSWDEKFCDGLLSKFKLDKNVKLKNLSRGMYAQVALIIAIAHHPELLILDDPTMGLDTVVRREFMEEIIGVLHEQDCTVFFSTHIIPEVENIADNIGIMKEGNLVISMEFEKLKESVKQIKLILKENVPEDISISGILKKESNKREILLTVQDYNHNIKTELANLNPVKHEIIDMSLEDIFIAMA